MAATDKKLSVLVDDQLPDFIKEEGPLFQEFIKAYYRWLEQNGKPHSELKSLLDYQDLDTTSDTFFEHIREEIAQNVPKDTEADQTFLLKRIKDVYHSKGSEASYKMLFRALFNEEIEIYYPEVDVLKTSDGRWAEEKSVRLTNLTSSNTALFDGKIVTGQTTSAKGRVQRIVKNSEYGVDITELYLSDIVGTFEDGELVCATSNTICGTIFNDTGSLQDVVVQFPGSGHKNGDAVDFIAAAGTGANGVITATTDRSLITFELKDGGSGYTTNAEITITSEFGQDASFAITSLSNTEVITYYTDTIGALKDVPLNAGPTFVTGGANSAAVSANLASANVTTTLAAALGTANQTTGTINTISTTNQGFGYLEFPTISIREPLIADLGLSDGSGGIKGENAVVVANSVPGAIRSVRVNTIGSSYSKFEPVTIRNNSRSGTVNATGAPLVSGFVEYPGRYTDTKGWLSWNNRLQDGFFYQKFSYVIRSDKFVNDYRKAVNDLLHPAGTKFFGEAQIELDTVEANSTIDACMEDYSIVIECEDCITSVPEIVSQTQPQYTANGITQVFEWDPEVVATMPTVTEETEIVYYTQGTGNIFIEPDGVINDYASDLLSSYSTTEIQALGNPKFVSGNNTLFLSEVSNGSYIYVSGGAANTFHVVDTVSTNTTMTLTIAYPYAPLSNGIFFVANNVV